MKVPHVDTVKEKLGEKALSALKALFTSAKGQPPSVPVERFRADHHQWLDVLNDLEHRHSFIERDHDGKSYLLRSYALPLIDDAEQLLEIMQLLFERLRELYAQHLSEPQDIDTLIEGISGGKTELHEALYYLSESHNVWSGKSIDFPYAKDSYLCIAEGVLRQESIAEILSQYYEWHYINPKKIVEELSESDQAKEASTFFAHEMSGGFPDWYEHLDDTKKALISEIDVALAYGLSALPTTGIRTLLDMVIVEKVGDVGTFKQKLQKFEQEGFITKIHAEMVGPVLDAGNAAAHRAYFPNEEDLKTCIDVVKNLMESIYILRPKIEKLRENTPKRKHP